MPQRFTSLYYGSIGRWKAIRALIAWVMSVPFSRDRTRARLAAEVHRQLGTGVVFPMATGRGALAAFLKAAGVTTGSEVIVSSYSCLAVPTAVLCAGGTPVYTDIDAETLNADVDAIEDALSPRTRAIVVQHTLGKPAPVREIMELARSRGVFVIEDCALAIGSRIDGRAVGTFADAAMFSMELSKTLSAGWGGILVVHDRGLADATEALYRTLPERSAWASARDLMQAVASAFAYHPAHYHIFGRFAIYGAYRLGLFRRSTRTAELEGVIAPDFMAKMGAGQVALARIQWRDLDRIARACEWNARTLRAQLSSLGAATPGAPADGETCVTPRVSLLVNDRAQMTRWFHERGVEVGEWFDGPMSPVPSSPRFQYRVGAYPRAEGVAARVANLPCHSRLSAKDLAHVIETLSEFARRHPGQLVRHDAREPMHVHQ